MADTKKDSILVLGGTGHYGRNIVQSLLKLGESVKVIDGPFNSFTGVIEEVNDEKKKLKVMVKIFGRKTPLELSFMQVEKDS